ncbi:hypothetical protein KBZ12_08290 [Cyanobium sp. Cruz CV13-4-11]|jgi:hypothetical protein|uniref:hypothetical protein n=1 Tax=unclassified Cyanobium TaxID=2627006 RepID=UPI0020CF3510|nr:MULTISPECIES: hypothetical protein [unclassified Cyanobium]MCP9900399.1 hypothetical protein [Cyanobium sp. Cruz CV11-17]MCP9919482.1 hypothetical protein [Cyanobium sp. Cruz CV13-4-11]
MSRPFDRLRRSLVAPALPRLPLPRLPLPATAATLLVLLLLPGLALWRWPRPRAQGLEQLMAASSLLQSFAASPDRPVPALWRERFGVAPANRLWREQRRTWWQFWGPHAEAGAYLAVQDNTGSQRPLPANGLRVGNLLVVAPDPLSRRLLQDQLRPDQRAGRGLYSACLPRLESGQGVFWNASGLGALVGPLAPLLEAYQEGCLSLSLSLESSELRWRGEATDRAAAAGTARSVRATDGAASSLPPLPSDLLLELQGSSLEQLFRGLLSRQLIRDPLAARYGIDTKGLALLRRSPFRLRLQPQASGPFQASLELQVAVGPDHQAWRELLLGLARSLQAQALQDVPGASPPSQALAATWRREDGVVLGGWRWIGESGPQAQLLLFLGPVPSRWQTMTTTGVQAPGSGSLWLRVRPQGLDQLGLLPEPLPDLVRRADQLAMEAAPGAGGVSWLRGRLRVIP